jgi:methionyl aminopeptidase
MLQITLKTPAEINKMRKANMIVYEVLHALKDMSAPGVTTADLDAKAVEIIKKAGAMPTFLNYVPAGSRVRPFPATICASKNEVIVHGIPDKVPLNEGDIVSIDCGCKIDDFCGDSAITFAVGKAGPLAERLMKTTESCLSAAIAKCVIGNRIGDISNAVQTLAEKAGFGVVREFVGHGIGHVMHEPPHIPNYGQAGQGRILREGLVIAIEPMITEGSYEVQVLNDGWTAVTKDRKLAAHFEHTIAITKKGPVILSYPE